MTENGEERLRRKLAENGIPPGAVDALVEAFAPMWHNHKNVQPYVFEGNANWTTCQKCATKYPEGEFHSCPDVRFDLLGRPKA